MKKLATKITAFLLAIMLAAGSLQITSVSAKSKSEKVLYENYIQRLWEKGYVVSDAVMRDINKDGTKEMLVVYLPYEGANRADGLICTIKKGKVKLLKKFTGGVSFYYKSGKTIVVSIDSGGSDIKFVTYKISSGKLKVVTTYKSAWDSGKNKTVYKKGSRIISETAFFNYMDSLKFII